MLCIENITKKYGKVNVVDDLSFKLQKNNITGFIGHNGAGKSTTIKCIMGITKPSSGNIYFDKQPMNKSKNITGYLPENPAFPEELKASEFLSMVCDIYKLKDKKEKIANAIKQVSLSEHINKKIKNYSKGMKQRLGIAQAIINEPTLLILDEPFSGLDPIGMKEIRNVLLRIKKNTTILISSHLIFDLEKICDQFIIIKTGKIVGETKNQNINIEKYYESKMKEAQ